MTRTWFMLMFGRMLVSGCEANRPAQLVPVEGELLIGGIPGAGVQLSFHPRQADSGTRIAVGVTDLHGRFHLSTFRPNDGALPGEYVVTAVWPNDTIPKDECLDPSAHDRLKGQYGDPAQSPLRVTIVRDQPTLRLHIEMVAKGWTFPKRREREGSR